MATLTRPAKKAYGTTSYVGELNAAAPNDALIFASDVDGDIDPLYAALNNLTSLPPSGPAGGDLAGSTYPNPVLANGVVSDAKIASVAYSKVTGHPAAYPPSGPAGGDLGAAGSTYPNPVVAPGAITRAKIAPDAWLPPVPSGANVGQVLGVTTGPALAYILPPGGPPSGAAGGDLTGTYPNPTLKPTSLPWTPSGATLTPTDPTKIVAIPGPTASAATVLLGTQTAKGRLQGSTTAASAGNVGIYGNRNSVSNAQDDVTRPSYGLTLNVGADQAVLERSPAGSTTQVALTAWDYLGNLYISGSIGQKSSGTTWTNPSDPRLKDDVAPYARGLADILPLEPITYRLKAQPSGPLCYGFDAAQVRTVFPECVTETRMRLAPNDAEETDGVLAFDMHPMLVAFVNAVKELARRVAALEESRRL